MKNKITNMGLSLLFATGLGQAGIANATTVPPGIDIWAVVSGTSSEANTNRGTLVLTPGRYIIDLYYQAKNVSGVDEIIYGYHFKFDAPQDAVLGNFRGGNMAAEAGNTCLDGCRWQQIGGNDLGDWPESGPILAMSFDFEGSSGDYVNLFGSYTDRNFKDQALPVTELVAVQAVPVPPAVWLFGSGLIGLVSVARRRVG